MTSLNSFIEIYGNFLTNFIASVLIIGIIVVLIGIGSGLYHWAKKRNL